jgi:excisionase family DNA binding protein
MPVAVAPFDEDRLTRAQAAEYLGLKNPDTLAVWASTRRYNLPFVRVGSRVFYRRSDLDRFIQRRTVGGEAAETQP